MDSLFALIFLASLICLIIGLVRPTLFNKILKGEVTRKKVLLVFGGASVVSLIIFGMVAPATEKTDKNVAENSNTVVNQNTNVATANINSNIEQKEVTSPQVVSPTEVVPPVKEVPVYAQFSDGMYVVNTDIKPGTYRTREASSGCYYSRLGGFSGGLSDIISNNNTDDPTIITISASDKGFQSVRCGTWTQDLSAITTDKTIIENGTFIVGTDILPGTYKSTASSGCYYSRLKGFSDTLSDILSNDNTDNAAIVTISKSDKGFKSERCGTWTKIK